MRVIVLGGDGFCGWPVSLHLSSAGYDVVIVDNGITRKTFPSLTPITPLGDRVRTWRKLTGRTINVVYARVDQVSPSELVQYSPDAIVHLAEQRSAPYSMKSSTTRLYTVNNNIGSTHAVLDAIVVSGVNTHLVHLGTTGVYGYGFIQGTVPEGYVTLNGIEVLHPQDPGSVYHMTKCMDELMFAYYAKNYGVRVTDLHQGIVWGTQTVETAMNKKLINRFDYDGDQGTVLNRFLMQAAIGHPLTVYGTGGQKRAFIHISDTVRCVRAAVESPMPGGKPRIMNQLAETCTVLDLASMVSAMTGAKVQHVQNPRKEAEANDLDMDNNTLQGLGVDFITLKNRLLEETVEIAQRYADRADVSLIPCTSEW